MQFASLFSTLVLLLLVAPCIVTAHLGFSEPQRLRHDYSLDATEGYAAPDPSGAEDYSFEKPFNMFTNLAIPASPAPGSQPVRRDSQSFTISTTLVGWDDYDVFLFNKTGNASSYDFLLFASVPACRENLDFYPSVALLGPLGTLDLDTGASVFTDPATMSASDLADLPFDIPEGLGIRVKHFRRANANEPRPAYHSTQGNTYTMYAQGWRSDCLEAPWAADCPFEEFAIKHRVDNPGLYYGVTFRNSRSFSDSVQDVQFVGGTGEGFVASDFARLAVLSQATSFGRSIHGRCRAIPEGRITFDTAAH